MWFSFRFDSLQLPRRLQSLSQPGSLEDSVEQRPNPHPQPPADWAWFARAISFDGLDHWDFWATNITLTHVQGREWKHSRTEATETWTNNRNGNCDDHYSCKNRNDRIMKAHLTSPIVAIWASPFSKYYAAAAHMLGNNWSGASIRTNENNNQTECKTFQFKKPFINEEGHFPIYNSMTKGFYCFFTYCGNLLKVVGVRRGKRKKEGL